MKALPDSGADDAYVKAKTATITFYMDHVLPLAVAEAGIVMKGAASVNDVDPALL